MWTPLIVKAPGQSEPRVDDANVQSIDVLPTLASLIGVEIPWSVDGVDVAGDELAARGDRKSFWRFETVADPHPSSDVEVDGAAGFATMLDMAFPAVGPDDDPDQRPVHPVRTGRARRRGLPSPPPRSTGDAIAVDDLDRLLDSDEPVLVLTGTVDDERGADHVVAALDGRIVAVSPVVERADGGPAFALLLPTDRPVDLGQVSLGLLRGSEVLDVGSLG